MLKKYREVQEHADFRSALFTRCDSSKHTEKFILDYNVASHRVVPHRVLLVCGLYCAVLC